MLRQAPSADKFASLTKELEEQKAACSSLAEQLEAAQLQVSLRGHPSLWGGVTRVCGVAHPTIWVL